MTKKCEVEWCDRDSLIHDLCGAHYWNKKHGKPFTKDLEPLKECDADGCNNDSLAKGFCSRHYQIWKRNGVPETALSKRREKKGGHGWINGYGYRMLWRDGTHILEHRYLMEQHLGRKLKKSEHIHHVNGDKTDNRIENLEITSNHKHKSAHCREYPNGEKPCSKCGEVKELSQFSFRLNSRKVKVRRRFYNSWCKQCCYKVHKERRHKRQAAGLPYT
jgi:hypothetical protein